MCFSPCFQILPNETEGLGVTVRNGNEEVVNLNNDNVDLGSLNDYDRINLESELYERFMNLSWGDEEENDDGMEGTDDGSDESGGDELEDSNML